MVNCFLAKFSQVKALFVYIVFIVLSFELAAIVAGFDFAGNQQSSSTKCHKCNEEYKSLTSWFKTFEGKPTTRRHWCSACKQFQRCVKPLEFACRPDLNFQAGRSVVTEHMKNYRCDSLFLTWNETLDIISKLKLARRKVLYGNPMRKCHRPNYKPKYKICGLFGDPHLRTFDDKRHTCSVPGAWPLFANRHLTVQVTNIPLENDMRATATSKVTVIVKEFKRKCIKEKTYQARSFSLPAVFTDGTKSTDDTDCPTQIRQLERAVLLDICSLKTVIIIRQVGKYLTVHMRVPERLMKRKTIGLCQHGCPRIEQMNLDRMPRVNKLIASLNPKNTLSKKVKRQRYKRARRLCRAARVTGFYYKSCLFDLLASGDSSFVKAAKSAMKDFRKINKDDQGKTIVNETVQDLYTGSPKGADGVQLPSDRNTPGLRPTSSSGTVTWSINNILFASLFTFLFVSRTVR